ncbi:hypothetical protein CDV50_06210 [Haematobacter massiliensis]|uniref:Ribosomal protein L21 n=1 Tax=Haematobacter massiliensis TaxID=195105 RepID=A0A086YCZ0_9RHOB|nr:hypothetical protein [Haematobacter massiliensis]KFI32140.1 ribosomal protein L21 [Haematobacter massiliensis]OWJ72733.1 hypothetical protein CDV50_06210 [Haematobacter massiliensis]OWJ85777.1 hypothetical protein CDV51_11095 [Haematobacter massiliensis]QBJ24519.1 hypothetical protein HmaOT1_09800 [Haematobacter massiliensis]
MSRFTVFVLSLVLVIPAATVTRVQAEGVLTETSTAEVTLLLNALHMEETLDTLRREGLAYGASIEGDLFPGRGGKRWEELVSAIYAPDRLKNDFLAAFSPAFLRLSAADRQAAQRFFTDPLGQRVVLLENEARVAQLDEAVEDASRDRAEEMIAQQDPRVGLIDRFVEANDLVEANVVGALNANIAFYSGLNDGRAFDAPLSEEDILKDVTSQADDVRQETEDWLYSYLLMAYQPLTDAELELYTAFTLTPAGQGLNRALFTAYDGLFERVSYDLGRSAARFLSGQDL